jgi:hypothetical protein
MRNPGLLLAWLLWGATGCAGGQTGEPGSGPALVCDANAVTGDDAERLFAQFEGAYEGLVVSSSSSERCPMAEPVTFRAVVTRTESDVSLADRPCGAHYVAVSVAVGTDDGQLDSTVDGWIDEEGRLSLSTGEVLLNIPQHSVTAVGGFGELRSIEPCCVEQPSDTAVSVLGELGTTELLDFEYSDPDTTRHQTRLSFSLATAAPRHACDTIDATFELRNADGELAASGEATATYQACAAADCLSLSVEGAGAVQSEAALLGSEDFPGHQTELNVTFTGQSQAGALSASRLICETKGDGAWGAALGLE